MHVLSPLAISQVSGGTKDSRESKYGLLDGVVFLSAFYYHGDLKKAVNTYEWLRPILHPEEKA